MKVALEFKPRDLWVGAYWERDTRYQARYDDGRQMRAEDADTYQVLQHGQRVTLTPTSITEITETRVWVCLVPMVPLALRWERRRDVSEDYL